MGELTTKQRAVSEQRASLVLQLRRGGPQSRAELSRSLSLAASTTGAHVESLIESGFVREGEPTAIAMGRPPTVLELSPEAGQFIGVDIEARQIEALSVDFAQRPRNSHRRAIPRSARAQHYVEEIDAAICAVADDRPITGIGIAVPGIVDPVRGVAVHHSLIRDWNDLRLAQHLSERFDAPVSLENNVRSMALAERWFGQGRNCDNFVCIGIRSGIAAGIFIDGELYRGPGNLAGEIGHWRNLPSQASTLADVASIRAILNVLTQKIKGGRETSLKLRRGRLSLEDVLANARQADELTLEVLHKAARFVGHAASHLNLLLNPDRIVIAGPLTECGDIFLAPIRNCVHQCAPPDLASVPDIVASTLGDQIGAIGATSLAVRQWQPGS